MASIKANCAAGLAVCGMGGAWSKLIDFCLRGTKTGQTEFMFMISTWALAICAIDNEAPCPVSWPPSRREFKITTANEAGTKR